MTQNLNVITNHVCDPSMDTSTNNLKNEVRIFKKYICITATVEQLVKTVGLLLTIILY